MTGRSDEVGFLDRIRLYFETLRYVRPVQIYGRLLAPFRRRVARIGLPAEAPQDLPAPSAIPLAPHHDPWNDRLSILEGRFSFLNRSAHLGWPPNWHPDDRTLLWCFTLHYHQFLPLLEREEQRCICRDWIDENPPGSEPGWHPYPLSRRIVIWTRLGLDGSRIRDNLYKQTTYLARTVEGHQPGNHLLENGHALALAGARFLPSHRGANWWKQGTKILRDELSRQLLPDGGHMERSPMYHALVLEAVGDVLAVDANADRALLSSGDRHKFVVWAENMGEFLAATTHPDGGLALLNDSALKIAPATDRLLAYSKRFGTCGPEPKGEFPETGYFIHQDDSAYLILDGGPIGPDHLPAHSHADLFTFELSLGEERFVVDGGVYEYQAGERRRYARSTAAHNTVTVDGVDQAECWDSFRVARRFPPRNVRFSREADRSVFSACFEGYRHLVGDDIVHRRDLVANGEAGRISVHDQIAGRGEHEVVSRIRIHPDAEIERVSDHEVQARRRRGSLTVNSATHMIRKEMGWYYPEFGEEQQITVLACGGRETLPVDIRYELLY